MSIITEVGFAYEEIMDLGLWKDVTAALLGACFSGLKKLNIIFAHGFNINISLMNVEAFKASEYMSNLHSRQGLDVNVIGRVGRNGACVHYLIHNSAQLKQITINP